MIMCGKPVWGCGLWAWARETPLPLYRQYPGTLFIAIGGHAIGAISAVSTTDHHAAEIAQIIQYLKVSAVFCDNQEQVDKVKEVRNQIPNVKKVIFEDLPGHARLHVR